MSISNKTVKDMKTELQKIPSIIPWEKVEVNKIYHIPPIISLKRREIIITDKDDNSAKYRRVDGTETQEGVLHKTSVLARFLVVRKKY